jgi:hypothetical protein
MPVVVPSDAFDLWLDPNADPKTAASLMVPAPDDLLEACEVSAAVNRVANDDPSLLMPASEMPDPVEEAKPKSRPKQRPRIANDAQGSLF